MVRSYTLQVQVEMVKTHDFYSHGLVDLVEERDSHDLDYHQFQDYPSLNDAVVPLTWTEDSE